MINRRANVSPWDIAAIGVLGAFGFALSYDALQQMAQAIHVRGQLSYAFPVVVDGFIAYGVRALVLLREAPWTARAYTWALFASATGTSVWANALHAIRLNEQAGQAKSLRLGDVAVGSLSTIAPLALAGAVHLGIIITRHGGAQPQTNPASDQQPASSPEAITLGRITDPTPSLRKAAPVETLDHSASQTTRAELTTGTDRPYAPRSAADKLRAHRQGTRLRDRLAARIRRRTDLNPPADGLAPRSGGDGPASRSGGDGPASRSGGDGPASRSGGDGPASRSGGDGPASRSGGDGPDPELLRIGRVAAANAGRVTRAVVATAIREQGLTASNQKVGKVLQALRTDRPPPHTR
ncbi:hypothetical protein KNE206_53010 [Kitasatospora sp. NE20-6]|uniref:DUF2637 domain-containing protein n=1 Tax=Kitasatospora sp. NE20-6 TaxID=2859066 RepID=UPI0034DC3D09